MSGLKLGLNVHKTNQQLAKPKKAVFDSGDDSDDHHPASPKKPTRIAPKRTDFRKKPEKDEIDPSIYDYDAAYDAIHAKSTAKVSAARDDVEQRKPKYVGGLLASAEVRKRDQLRARDKLLQREREAEGDEFADKEKFVTGAYKEQQEELRRLETEEKIKEESEAQKRRESGMHGFYRTMMDRDEQRHQEVVEAAANASKSDGMGMGVKAIEGKMEKSEADVARELNAKGANIIINEEGQVADKRQLLSAGLNVAPEPKPTSAVTSQTVKSQYSRAPTVASLGRNDHRNAIRERQSRMLEEQLEQATKRAADEEAEEYRKQEHAAKSKKSSSDVSNARERYLQRKREAAAAAGNATKP